MKTKHLYLVTAALALFAAGCSSVKNVAPSDLTVAELESKQMEAVDPGKRMHDIRTSILRQEITTSHGWGEPDTIQMVEIKYKAPDKMSITTFDENQPTTALIVNGKQAWRVDYDRKTSDDIGEEMINDIKFMQDLAKPTSKMSELFDQVTIDRCTIDDEELYRLTCVNPEQNPFYVFISADDFLPRRITSNFVLEGGGTSAYDSHIIRYQMYEGLMLADETQINTDGLIQKGKVLYYKVNTPINDKEFLPPAF